MPQSRRCTRPPEIQGRKLGNTVRKLQVALCVWLVIAWLHKPDGIVEADATTLAA